MSLDDVSQQQIYKMSCSHEHHLQSAQIDFPRGRLTDLETYILCEIYEKGQTSASIARTLGITRQSVNQTKKRAEKKLKACYIDE